MLVIHWFLYHLVYGVINPVNFKTKDYKFNSFITRYGKPEYVRQYLLLILLCIIFFFLPLQVFIIGDFSGIGVQGAVYRYQTSVYGTACHADTTGN